MKKTKGSLEFMSKKATRREMLKYTGLFMGSTVLGDGLLSSAKSFAGESLASAASPSVPRTYVNNPLKKIDVFCHILPEKYLSAFKKKSREISRANETKNIAVTDINMRLRLMDRYPDVLQVISLGLPPVESLLSPADAVELSKIANDELAELVAKYPDKFLGAVACLPLNDMDAALKEADRAISQLKLKGVQITTTINGETLNSKKFWPLYEKMADYDLPIWIHPISTKTLHEPLFGWLYETASAMRYLVGSGIFYEYPDIKFITHHCGSMIPTVANRIQWMFSFGPPIGPKIRKPLDHFRKFYNDTALYGNTSGLMNSYNFFGADRLLFGTDAPLGPEFGLTSETIRSIERMDIPDNDKEKIFVQNAVKLLRTAI